MNVRAWLAVLSVTMALCGASVLGASPVVPRAEQHKMRAALPEFAYVPSTLPPGVIFINWKAEYLTPMACGEHLEIAFAGNGERIDWSSSRFCGSWDVDVAGHPRPGCYSDGYPGYGRGMEADHSARINGRRVYFSQGNHGSNAWACIPLTARNGDDMAVAGIWESNFMSPSEAMRLVAFAQPAR